MSLAIITILLAGATGALLFLYIYGYLAVAYGWAAGKYATLKATVVATTGAIWAWTVDFYTSWMAYIQEGLAMTDPYMTVFVLGYIALVIVLIINLLITMADPRKKLSAVQ